MVARKLELRNMLSPGAFRFLRVMGLRVSGAEPTKRRSCYGTLCGEIVKLSHHRARRGFVRASIDDEPARQASGEPDWERGRSRAAAAVVERMRAQRS